MSDLIQPLPNSVNKADNEEPVQVGVKRKASANSYDNIELKIPEKEEVPVKKLHTDEQHNQSQKEPEKKAPDQLEESKMEIEKNYI